ncbi:MAG: AAA domain-containing protein [bacterium]|nr:AAA domain-containing protein [bacterium]
MSTGNTVVFGLLGTVLDYTPEQHRWDKWRPTVSIFQHEDLLVDRFVLLHDKKRDDLASRVCEDIATVSPETEVIRHILDFKDPWDFEEVYGTLHDFLRSYPFDPEEEQYLLHITTGTHVAQICMFLLTESNYFPGKLLQTNPIRKNRKGPGGYTIIDLDLSRYDRIAQRFQAELHDDLSFLKSGIETRNARFNNLIEQIEQVAIRSDAPLLLTGATGAGKSRLAERIYDLKKARRQVSGEFVEVNCATLRGDAAMSAMFGHVKGSFTGALRDRAGLLRTADGGILLLDEVGELGMDEQAMLLRAIEEGRFLPVGADKEVASSFQLVCGTNRDLKQAVANGTFREDLLARINLWTFHLPGLAQRGEDIAPNLEYELSRLAEVTGTRTTFNKEARQKFLRFATSPEAIWPGNFRDLNGAVVRMATFATSGRITVDIVADEIKRLESSWIRDDTPREEDDLLFRSLGPENAARLDRFDYTQLAEVLKICQRHKSLSDAGRALFAESRKAKQNPNDADRLRKYLARYGLTWRKIQEMDD